MNEQTTYINMANIASGFYLDYLLRSIRSWKKYHVHVETVECINTSGANDAYQLSKPSVMQIKVCL